jgi:hypothetical protein
MNMFANEVFKMAKLWTGKSHLPGLHEATQYSCSEDVHHSQIANV